MQVDELPFPIQTVELQEKEIPDGKEKTTLKTSILSVKWARGIIRTGFRAVTTCRLPLTNPWDTQQTKVLTVRYYDLRTVNTISIELDRPVTGHRRRDGGSAPTFRPVSGGVGAGDSMSRESIYGDGPGVGLGIRRRPLWSEIMRDTKARVDARG
uniref:Uncharacterized protein n=1 Tax=Oryza sativa subsp. japonica TaxID=39947 RepID=Q33B20_ORYSJ|nr:hypothetical protein LOC_Os10g05870 [Oryza sativa Japonica Group]